MHFQYRTDIDGLRAIAVLSVLFFHYDLPGFSGGFVGVDIFFVISGFLITRIILQDLKEEKFSISRFYERRIRRIFPALFSVIGFTLIVGWFILDTSAFKNLGQSVTATTLFSSNILFWRESGYFDTQSIYKPLLHTWSLSVEEQFYIFFPLVLVLIHYYQKKKYLNWILLILIFSLGLSIWGVNYRQMATFYLLPTRAWEILSGSILALGILPSTSNSLLKNLLSFIGLGLIIYSVGFYNKATLFPGYNSLLPVLGAVLIIYSNNLSSSIVGRILSTKPLIFIGLISYSLYLWHWPIVSFSKYLIIRRMTWQETTVIIVFSLLVATISWKYIEAPFRGKNPVFPKFKQLIVLAGVLIILFSVTGIIIHLKNGIAWRIERYYPEMTATVNRAINDSKWKKYTEWEKTTHKIIEGATPNVVGLADKLPAFALIGDSHARSLIPAMEFKANEYRISGYIITRTASPYLIGISSSQSSNVVDEIRYNNAIMNFIKSHLEIKTIFIACRWSVYIHGTLSDKGENPLSFKLYDTKGEYDRSNSNEFILGVGLKRTVQEIIRMNRKVVLVSDVPEIGLNVPHLYSMNSRFPMLSFQQQQFVPSRAEYNERQKEANTILEEIAELPGVELVRPERMMFDKNARARIIDNGELLYRDDDHLSTAGALFVAKVFDEVFKEIISK
jgi:peptidoglycan/LPS O-acetylase OafA/YrhL